MTAGFKIPIQGPLPVAVGQNGRFADTLSYIRYLDLPLPYFTLTLFYLDLTLP